jgi:hypothetical protein
MPGRYQRRPDHQSQQPQSAFGPWFLVLQAAARCLKTPESEILSGNTVNSTAILFKWPPQVLRLCSHSRSRDRRPPRFRSPRRFRSRLRPLPSRRAHSASVPPRKRASHASEQVTRAPRPAAFGGAKLLLGYYGGTLLSGSTSYPPNGLSLHSAACYTWRSCGPRTCG